MKGETGELASPFHAFVCFATKKFDGANLPNSGYSGLRYHGTLN
jgi:hypothetical protein